MSEAITADIPLKPPVTALKPVPLKPEPPKPEPAPAAAEVAPPPAPEPPGILTKLFATFGLTLTRRQAAVSASAIGSLLLGIVGVKLLMPTKTPPATQPLAATPTPTKPAPSALAVEPYAGLDLPPCSTVFGLIPALSQVPPPRYPGLDGRGSPPVPTPNTYTPPATHGYGASVAPPITDIPPPAILPPAAVSMSRQPDTATPTAGYNPAAPSSVEFKPHSGTTTTPPTYPNERRPDIRSGGGYSVTDPVVPAGGPIGPGNSPPGEALKPAPPSGLPLIPIGGPNDTGVVPASGAVPVPIIPKGALPPTTSAGGNGTNTTTVPIVPPLTPVVPPVGGSIPTPPAIPLPSGTNPPATPPAVPPIGAVAPPAAVPPIGVELPASPVAVPPVGGGVTPPVPVVPPVVTPVLGNGTSPKPAIPDPSASVIPPIGIAPPSSIAPPISVAPPIGNAVTPPAALPTTFELTKPANATETSPLPVGQSTPKTTFDVDLHRAKASDTYDTISREHYNDAKYAAALRQFNGGKSLANGGQVEVPPIHVLKKQFPGSIPSSGTRAAPGVTPDWNGATATGGARQPEFRATRNATYTVPAGGGMTLLQIAKVTLGSEQKWQDVWDLNAQLKPDDLLRPGTVVKLPSNARVQE